MSLLAFAFSPAIALTLFARPNRRTRLLGHSSRGLRQTRGCHPFGYRLARHGSSGLRRSTMCLPGLGPHPYPFHSLFARGLSLQFLFPPPKPRLAYTPVTRTAFVHH